MVTITFGSCKLRQSKPKNHLQTDATSLIDPSSVVFQRNPDRISGTLKFKTKVPVLCEIQYWTKDESTPPNESSPAVKPCSHQQAKKDIEESLSELQINDTYAFKVLLWIPELGKGALKFFRIEEDGVNEERPTEELMVAKTNLPQLETEIIRYKFPSSTNILSIKKTLEQPLGCQEAPPASIETYSVAQDDSYLDSISLRGFASGTATKHQYFPNRLLATYDFIERDQVWEWDFKYKNSAFYFATKPPSYLDSLIMTSSDPTRLKNKGLTTQIETFSIKRDILKWEWVTKNPVSNSYVMVLMRDLSGNNKLFCAFDANAGKGEIPKDVIDKLPAGDLEVTIILDSNQIYAQQNPNFPIWLLKTHDWRVAHLTLP